jgi:hypothetical protein
MGVQSPERRFSEREHQMSVEMETYEPEAPYAPGPAADGQALAEIRHELRAQRAEAGRVYAASPSSRGSRSSSRSPTSSPSP